ncbi:hypothetical protein [Arenimonas donghaensis]|nr:hypothetical protein [Arenimonas donghaensis]
MNWSAGLLHILPAMVLVLVFVPMAWLRWRSGRRPNRWGYLAWTMMAAMVTYSLVLGVLAMLRSP